MHVQLTLFVNLERFRRYSTFFIWLGFAYWGRNFGGFGPKWPLKRQMRKNLLGGHFLTLNCVFWAIVREIISIRLASAGAQDKRQEGRNVTRSVYFTYAWSDLWRAEVYKCVHLTDLIKRAKCHRYNLRSFGVVRCWSFHVAIGNPLNRPSLTHCLALPRRRWFIFPVYGSHISFPHFIIVQFSNVSYRISEVACCWDSVAILSGSWDLTLHSTSIFGLSQPSFIPRFHVHRTVFICDASCSWVLKNRDIRWDFVAISYAGYDIVFPYLYFYSLSTHHRHGLRYVPGSHKHEGSHWNFFDILCASWVIGTYIFYHLEYRIYTSTFTCMPISPYGAGASTCNTCTRMQNWMAEEYTRAFREMLKESNVIWKKPRRKGVGADPLVFPWLKVALLFKTL